MKILLTDSEYINTNNTNGLGGDADGFGIMSHIGGIVSATQNGGYIYDNKNKTKSRESKPTVMKVRTKTKMSRRNKLSTYKSLKKKTLLKRKNKSKSKTRKTKPTYSKSKRSKRTSIQSTSKQTNSI